MKGPKRNSYDFRFYKIDSIYKNAYVYMYKNLCLSKNDVLISDLLAVSYVKIS